MIGPMIEGFRVGQKVKINAPHNAPQNADHRKDGYIASIEQARGMYIFWIDFGTGRPRAFVSTQLREVQ